MKQILHTSVWALFAQHRDLRIVLPARALSMLGDQVTLVVLLLRIGERLTALHVTVLLMAFALPLFALAPLAGRIVDEHDSRRVLVAAGCVQVAASIALVLSPNFVLTIGAVLVLQAGQAVSAPAWAALLPRIVGDDNVGSVVGLSQSLTACAGLAGSALGGVLYAAVGLHLALVVDTVTFGILVVAGAAVRTRRGRRADGREAASADDDTAAESGLSFIRGDELLKLLIPALCLLVLFGEATNVVEVFLIRDSMGASAQMYGFATAAIMLGSIVGSLTAGRIRDDRGRVLCASLCTAALGVLLAATGISPTALAAMPLFLATGLAFGAINAAVGAVVLTRPPEALRGSVAATLNGLLRGATMLAMVVGGIAGSVLGPRETFVVAGLLTATDAFLILRSRRPASLAQPAAGPAA